MSYIELNSVSKIYKTKFNQAIALKDVSFKVNKNEFVVIVGPSGAGKTTLLNLIGGMDTVSFGEILIDEINIAGYKEKKLVEYRRNDIGFVFQFYNLIPNLTVYENVELASQICKKPLDAKMIIEKVGLNHRINNFPSQLSGGEQQRVSIARAIAKNPKILLCDEPTGALDVKTGIQILKLLKESIKEFDTTVILITHNNLITQMADKVIKVMDGKIKEIIINEKPKKVEEIQW